MPLAGPPAARCDDVRRGFDDDALRRGSGDPQPVHGFHRAAPPASAALAAAGVVAGARRSSRSATGCTRSAATRSRSRRRSPMRHGRSVQHLQDVLHLNWELSINHFVAAHEWLAQVIDYYYATLHFIITIGVLVWLFVRRPHIYRGARTVLFATTLVGAGRLLPVPAGAAAAAARSTATSTPSSSSTPGARWPTRTSPSTPTSTRRCRACTSGGRCGAASRIFMCARRPWVRAARAALPVLHPAGDRRYRQPLHHRRGRRRARCWPSASACSGCSPATAPSRRPSTRRTSGAGPAAAAAAHRGPRRRDPSDRA